MKRQFKNWMALLLLIFFILAGVLLYRVGNTFSSANLSKSESLILNKQISSDHYLLKSRNGSEIYRKGETQRISIASLTKIMTAICIIEHATGLDQSVTVPQNIFFEIEQNNLAVAGLMLGEKISYWDLLHGIILPSGADATLTAALGICEDEQSFVEIMNEKAAQLGMTATHFANSTGLDAAGHYSTIKDMMILLEYALKNDSFYQIFTSLNYQGSATNRHPEGNYFTSSMISRGESLELSKGNIIGGKTGYTPKAGLCLASLAEIDGEEYLLIIAGCKGSDESKQFNVIESRTFYNSIQ
ncbi:D-alanyl-D-alanine carboxypeptidase family protein [Enterococcus malodoratus]|uniref:Peptidase S11 D-alanyl-D-alanine carboxypeptidase A N-terminal domain-containing protein n=1 Tax=Enterococcus malodoratus ATCC 43197 TaxID=1158601 RepID=R2RH09_9ENTE|nr:D-alanyl-D-alanine carboxypeptidase [Enterococcus malodoratus]EOH75304.1 hypothetical protein UAI_03106 [Enterococcus malodoratus ATCC 43197]EOT66767.1 hypothetical protein I585_02288 [Enterococcus malodoratus ATCC 43197]OJG65938.1 hypothetical protein RV07_GL001525 [Enterococcus malodoratus]SPW90788.1 D-alanyl-D-alanine carboxypeptidase dacB precursor [Enterococcus malodoratus]STD69981.1 D-alanyl-D-alanine carboxypeptidase dacB precursor [Enterococcus malodoratus]